MFRWGKKKGKVFVGLSGGVDSGVSAALLKQQGYDVTGVFIRIALPGYPCSAGADKLDAMRVAAHLEIPFLELDLSKHYEQEIFKNTVSEFKKGRTPNPDVLCNREIKFGEFYTFAKAHGADYVATGHYAQTKHGMLYSATDPSKEQSYFLMDGSIASL
jgi:tRNA-specific 2-thiouridylase